MPNAQRSGHDLEAGASVVLLVTILGALGGLLLAWAADALGRAAPDDSQSVLRGGALVVPLAGGAALLAGGWTAIALWRSGHPRWGTGAALGAVVALAAALAMSVGPVLAVSVLGAASTQPGPAVAVVAFAFAVPLALATAGGLLLAAVFARLSRRARVAAAVSALATLAALAALPLVIGPVVFVVGPLLFAVVAALPLVVETHRAAPAPRLGGAALIAAEVALPAGAFAGFAAAVAVLTPG